MRTASCTAQLREPIACTDKERHEFECLVRQGFDGSDEGLPDRIGDAELLAFHYAADDTVAAVAALKAPGPGYRDDVFEKAGARVNAADFELEIGWVFVVPAHRGNRLGESLCRQLLERAPTFGVFATTRPNNTLMISILAALGFVRTGRPYPHVRRNEELALFLRHPEPPGQCAGPC